jgi:hypothetical protein
LLIVQARKIRDAHVDAATGAALLNVKEDVLELWATRFGFPSRHPGEGAGPRYSLEEVLALGEALVTESSIPAAFTKARAILDTRRSEK